MFNGCECTCHWYGFLYGAHDGACDDSAPSLQATKRYPPPQPTPDGNATAPPERQSPILVQLNLLPGFSLVINLIPMLPLKWVGLFLKYSL